MIIAKPPDHQKSRTVRRVIIYSATTIVVMICCGYLIWALRDLILPSVLGILLAYLFRPMIRSPALAFLPYKFRVLSSLMVVCLVFLGLFFLVQRSLPDDRGKLELRVRLLYKMNERYNSVMSKDKNHRGNFLYSMFGQEIDPLKNSFEGILALDPDEAKRFLDYSKQNAATSELSQRYLKYFQANQSHQPEREPSSHEDPATAKSESTLVKALHLASIWLLMPIIFLFLLFDDRHIVRYFVGLVPNRYFELTLTMIHEVDQAIGNYLRGTFLESLLVAIAFAIGLYVIGFPVKAAILIGIFAGMTNAIPFLGPIIGLIVSLIYALIAEDLTPMIPGLTADSIFIAVVAVVVVTHILDNVIFAPIVLGGAVNLHPLVVILGVMGGSLAFGFAGMLLAIPTIVVVKVMTETLFRGLKAYRLI